MRQGERRDSGYPSVDPGDLRHPITWLFAVEGTDSSGVSVTWQPSVPPVISWAKIEVMSARDLIRGGQTISQTMAVVTVRFDQTIVATSRFQTEWGSQFVVEGVNDIQNRHVLMELSCLGISLGANG